MDLGAEVIKIVQPGEGDSIRGANRNKKSVALDLTTAKKFTEMFCAKSRNGFCFRSAQNFGNEHIDIVRMPSNRKVIDQRINAIPN